MAADAVMSRTVRMVLACIALGSLTMFMPTAAVADCGGSETSGVQAETGVGTLVLGAEHEVHESTCDSGTSFVANGPRDSDLDALCVREAISEGHNPFAFCDLDPDDPIQLTPGMVAAAFRNLPLPASKLVVQPPGGRTLVNFATNFYTESGPFTRTVTLLGQRVELRIWPSRFGWRFGDGEQVATTSAGAAYPNLEITHDYLRAGGVSPSVDTTYAAQFSLNGGAWRDVTGTVTIPGSPVALEVTTASPVLVGYR